MIGNRMQPYWLQVIGYGDRVRGLADQRKTMSGGTYGKVRTSLRDTSYLELADDDPSMIIITKKSVRSPVAINVQSEFDLNTFIRQGDEYFIAPQGILSAEALLSKSDAVIMRFEGSVYSNLHKNTNRNNENYLAGKYSLEKVTTLLKSLDRRGSILDWRQPSREQFKGFVDQLLIQFSSSSIDSTLLSRMAGKLIGLGNGFTPSFDDFLSGFLSVYNFVQTTPEKKIIIDKETLIRKTAWVSASLLYLNMTGIFDEVLENTIVSITSGQADESVISNFHRLVQRGHTTGLDLAFGVTCAWAALLQSSSLEHRYDDMLEYILSSFGFSF